MRIEVWSDVICPWCYIGKRHLEAAIAAYAEAGHDVSGIDVVWRSFELDPHAPTGETMDLAATLAAKYGTTRDGAIAMMDRVASVAEGVGLHYRFDLAARSNSFDAHRLIHLGAEAGRQDAVKERLLAAYFCEGARIGDRDTLLGLATDAGLEPATAAEVLDGDRFAAEVRADEARAREIGITGVPFFLIEGAAGVSGAQPPERLLQMIERAAAKLTGTAEPDGTAKPDG